MRWQARTRTRHLAVLLDGQTISKGETGTAVKTSDGWKVSRDTYCALVAAAEELVRASHAH